MGTLEVVDMGIDTQQEPVVYMRGDCHIFLSEDFAAKSRFMLNCGANDVIATVKCKNVLMSSVAARLRSVVKRRFRWRTLPGSRDGLDLCLGHRRKVEEKV